MGQAKLSDRELALKSVQLRRQTLLAISHAGAGHTGGGLKPFGRTSETVVDPRVND